MFLSIFQTLPFRLDKARSDFYWDCSGLHENTINTIIERMINFFIVVRVDLGIVKVNRTSINQIKNLLKDF